MKKGYKVTDVKREKKIGVAAGNLEELISKSCNKLGVSNFKVFPLTFLPQKAFISSFLAILVSLSFI